MCGIEVGFSLNLACIWVELTYYYLHCYFLPSWIVIAQSNSDAYYIKMLMQSLHVHPMVGPLPRTHLQFAIACLCLIPSCHLFSARFCFIGWDKLVLHNTGDTWLVLSDTNGARNFLSVVLFLLLVPTVIEQDLQPHFDLC